MKRYAGKRTGMVDLFGFLKKKGVPKTPQAQQSPSKFGPGPSNFKPKGPRRI